MPLDRWDALPAEARVWAFGAGRALAAAEEQRLLDAVDAFLEGWQAHGHPLRCARDWREGRFLLVGVDERTAPPSGCSIDALVHSLKQLEDELEVSLVGHAAVFYRATDGDIRRDSRAELRAQIEAGHVDAATPVFDLTLTRMEQVRAGALERPASDTWLAKAYGLGVGT